MEIRKNERIVEKIVTTKDNGEITVNLNLKITIDGDLNGIQVSPQVSNQENPVKEEYENKQDIIPDELFDDNIIVDGFGKSNN
ncbi:MAG: hypothetical protein ACOCV1_03670 [Bacillota bacterium]